MPDGEPVFEVGKAFKAALIERLTETAKPCHLRIVGADDLPALRRAGVIPDGYKIVGQSAHFFFDRNDLALKIEHPDFSPITFPQPIPVLRLTPEDTKDTDVI